jgi:hypothetical protein
LLYSRFNPDIIKKMSSRFGIVVFFPDRQQRGTAYAKG